MMRIKRFLSALLTVAMMMSMLAVPTFAADTTVELTNWIQAANADWYGDGTAAEFTITTGEQLAGLAKLVNEGNSFSGKTILLGADIDLNGKVWTPIGTKEYAFGGTFDGANRKISNLYINDTAATGIGLFGVIGWKVSRGRIQNLTIENADLLGEGYVGGIAGNGYLCDFDNCHVTGSINIRTDDDSTNYVGGISGYTYGNAANCSTIDTTEDGGTMYGCYVGGIFGWTGEGTHYITDCTVKNIAFTGEAGGIVGLIHQGVIVDGNTVEGCSVAQSAYGAQYSGLVAGDNRANATNPNFAINNTVSETTGVTNTVPANENSVVGTGVVLDENNKVISATSLESCPASCVAEDAELVTNADGTFTVVASKTVAAKIGDVEYETLQDAINAAQNGDTITLFAGTHVIPNTSIPDNKSLTFTGAEKGVILDESGLGNEFYGSKYVFNNVEIIFPNTSHRGFTHCDEIIYNGCTFSGTQTLYATKVEFNSCVFNPINETSEYAVWTYAASDVTFTDCTFNTNGKAVLVYTEGAHEADIKLSECEFTSTGYYTGKAAVEVGASEGGVSTYNLSFTECTADEKFSANHSTSNLWGNKNDMVFENYEVTIDNVVVNAPLATVDGVGYTDLASAFNAIKNGSTVTIVENAVIEVTDWPEIVKDAMTFTIEGNGATIKGLTKPLISAAVTGSVTATVKDLTISNANIAGVQSSHSGVVNAGAFFGVAGHNDVVLTNCHVVDSIIGSAGDYYAGGFIGYSPGGTTVIDGCSVTNSTITAGSSTGGMVGHSYGGITITNSTVSGNTVTSTDSEVRPDKAGSIIGRNNGGADYIDVTELTASAILPAGTYANRAVGSIVGGTVTFNGGEYFADPSVAVEKETKPVIDGRVMYDEEKYFFVKAMIGETGYASLQKAINAAEDDVEIILIDDSKEQGTLIPGADVGEDAVQIPSGKNITINLGGFTFNGSLYADSATITLKNGTISSWTDASGIEVENTVLTLEETLNITSANRHAVRAKGGTTTIKGGNYVSHAGGTTHALYVSSSAVVTVEGGTFYTDGEGTSGCAVMIRDDNCRVAINGGDFASATNSPDGTLCITANSLTLGGGTFAKSTLAPGEGLESELRMASYVDGYTYGYDEATGKYIVGKAAAKIDDKLYLTIADAVDAVNENETIIVLAESIELPIVKKNNVTIKTEVNTTVTNTINQPLDFGGENGLILDGFVFTQPVRYEAADMQFLNCEFVGEGKLNACWANGTWVIDGCTFEGVNGWGMHFDGGNSGVVNVTNTTIAGYNPISDLVAVNFDECTFTKGTAASTAQIMAYGNVTISNSTFAADLPEDYISTARATAVIEVETEDQNIFNYVADSISGTFVVNPSKDENGLYTAGTFASEPAAGLLAEGYEAVANENGTFGVIEETQEEEPGIGSLIGTVFFEQDGKLKIAMISGIDSLDYDSVGFEIIWKGNTITTAPVKTVFKSVTAANGTFGTDQFSTPEYTVNYLFGQQLSVNKTDAGEFISFRAYAKTNDDSYLYSKWVTRYADGTKISE